MSTNLYRFTVRGLHGRPTTIEVEIADNRLILVGENGTGKSTVANLIYYTLTRQWRRVLEYRFEYIHVVTSEGEVHLAHADIVTLESFEQGAGIPRQLRFAYPSHTLRNIYSILADEAWLLEGNEESVVTRISEAARVPRTMAMKIIHDFHNIRATKLPRGLLQEVQKLKLWKFGQFLYLPTYRRIEQDLKSIFRGLEIEEKLKEFREQIKKREKLTYVELIEFGMEDVENTIQARMIQIKESVRTGLSTLTGTYLREVIRGLQENPDLSVLRSMDLTGFQSMFARIDEAILPNNDKTLLQTKIAEISKGAALGPDDKVIAHFLSKLLALYKKQQESESDVRDFVKLCNQYLTNKRFIYDDIRYEIFIQQGMSADSVSEAERLSLKVLSSGEKQIVSLFSHIYFSGEAQFFVVIDEPELSLSVPWQQRFLTDIIKTNRSTGVLAVTHSPFIWENELETHVKSLAECITDSNVVHRKT